MLCTCWEEGIHRAGVLSLGRVAVIVALLGEARGPERSRDWASTGWESRTAKLAARGPARSHQPHLGLFLSPLCVLSLLLRGMAGQGHGDLGIGYDLQCRTSISEAPPTLENGVSQGHPLSSHPCAPRFCLVIPFWWLLPLLDLIEKSSRFLRGTRTLRSRPTVHLLRALHFPALGVSGGSLEAFQPGEGGVCLPVDKAVGPRERGPG